MTLKELRINKGLSQKDCADFLNMTVRNYQNYESGSYSNVARYNYIYKKIESYSLNGMGLNNSLPFFTYVVCGSKLDNFYKSVESFNKRDCYSVLKKYLDGSYEGKICILYGLRRTGKTTLLFQLLGELDINECAYIKIKNSDNMANLTKDINTLSSMGIKYIFIDEITLLNDFINTAAVLSDIFCMMGMKIIVSGTDSLGFSMASRDELYNRNIMVHTSYIPYREYERLLHISSIDSYIEYGGTLMKENMDFDDPDAGLDEVAFKDDESTRKYIDTAISRNIQHTLKNNNFGEYFNHLSDLYEYGELTNVINRIVENLNHQFLLSVIEEKFKSHDLGSAKNLLLHEAPNNRAYVLYDIDGKEVINTLKKIIDVKEKEELKVEITEDHINQIKKYLLMLDLIDNCPDRFESGKKEDHYIFSQPGMRYAIAKALVYSLMQDKLFNSMSSYDIDYVVHKILEDVKGRMLEEIVLLEIKKGLDDSKDVFKFKFDAGGEFDMVIYDKLKNTCKIYEIKHSKKIVNDQMKFLLDKDKCNIIENKYGKITNKYVLYRGTDEVVNEVEYMNVENYLADSKYR